MAALLMHPLLRQVQPQGQHHHQQQQEQRLLWVRRLAG
jgi:hypothetical protein